MIIILTICTGIWALCVFMMSHEYSKNKYYYGKNERVMDEDEGTGNIQSNESSTTRTNADRHTMSKLHENKTTLLQSV